MTSSEGVVIFAYNTEIDYIKIATACAALVRRQIILEDIQPYFTRISVTLITDEFGALQADKEMFDNIIVHNVEDTNMRRFKSNGKTIQWKNGARADVYDLTPYDKTLLIDCDYFMFNDSLLELFQTDIPFTCYDTVVDVTGTDAFRSDNRLSQYSIPMLWASVIYFQKTEFSKSIFEMMKIVKENYQYYSLVYGFKNRPFRNDYALSIAFNALAGYGNPACLPYAMPMLPETAEIVEVRPDGKLIYQYKNNNGQICTGFSEGTDLHIMNKAALTDKILSDILKYAKR